MAKGPQPGPHARQSDQQPQRPLVSLVIPTRNEAGNIQPLLRGLEAALADVAYELVFVDDSEDDTAAQIRQAQAATTRPIQLHVRSPAEQDGLSGAVVAGFKQARGTWLAVMDADLQHPPQMVARLLTHARETAADIVVGSRRGNWFGPLGLSFMRALNSQALTVLARSLFPQVLKNVSDPLTGLFLVKREKVQIDLLRPDGFKILLEILVRCPQLRVSELNFDFAERHSGSSKADVREGLRFFRHLLRLRLTAARWFPRYVAVRFVGLLVNLGLFLLLTQRAGWHYLLAAVAATELTVLWNFVWTDLWVFNDGEENERRRRLSQFLLVNQLFLLLRLPILYGLVTAVGLPPWLALFIAIVAVGMVKYGASEQWIWNKGLSWQPPVHYYDIHGLVTMASQVRLPELGAFAAARPPAHIDIRLRVDRHGTPSRQPGAIFYDEALGRFGFGVSVMPAEQTEVVVSPILSRAPFALYKSVLEPLLRWAFLRRGYVLVPVAGVALADRGVLVAMAVDQGKTATALALVGVEEARFLGDDGVIIGADGTLYSFPRPVTISPHLLATAVTHLDWRRRWRLRWQTLLYSRPGRRAGLWFSSRRLPMATLNLYLQRLAPPPKITLAQLLPKAELAPSASLASLVVLATGTSKEAAMSAEAAAGWLHRRCQQATGFPPYGDLWAALRVWQGTDWTAVEAGILRQGLAAGRHWQVQRNPYNWWPAIAALLAAPEGATAVTWQGGSADKTAVARSQPDVETRKA